METTPQPIIINQDAQAKLIELSFEQGISFVLLLIVLGTFIFAMFKIIKWFGIKIDAWLDQNRVQLETNRSQIDQMFEDVDLQRDMHREEMEHRRTVHKEDMESLFKMYANQAEEISRTRITLDGIADKLASLSSIADTMTALHDKMISNEKKFDHFDRKIEKISTLQQIKTQLDL